MTVRALASAGYRVPVTGDGAGAMALAAQDAGGIDASSATW